MNAVMQVQEPGARYLAAVQPALVRQFELLATAPGGVGRLRELILSLAVQGKLVTQDPTDESAAVLMKRVQVHRDRADGARVVAHPKREPPAAAAEDLPALPMGWEWVRFAELIEPAKPIAYGVLVPGPEASGGVPFVRISDLSLTDAPEYPEKSISAEVDAQYQRTRLEGGEILMGVVGSIGKLGVAPMSWAGANIARAVCRIVPVSLIDRRYVLVLLQSEFMRSRFVGDTRTLAQPTLNVGLIRNSPTPLPPLAEQARIVARVDELMRLCDALEAQGRLEAEQHARLLGTLLGTLTDSRTPEELAANWQRVADHLDLLLDRPEAVDALEQTILQLAVRGLLVPQNPNDEPAAVLISQIRAATAAQFAHSSRRKTRADLPAVDDCEWPFEPPQGWVWTRFGEVTQVSGGVTLGRKGAIASPLSLPYLRVANVQRWRLVLDSMRDIVIDESELPRYQLADGDLLITEGGDWDKVGRTAIWRSELPACLHQNHVFKARGYTSTWNPGWAELYLNLDVARAYFAASAKQTTNLASINMTELRHCVFPLPPLNEQARILARVTELRRLCAALRQSLTAGQTTQSHLAEALVGEVV